MGQAAAAEDSGGAEPAAHVPRPRRGASGRAALRAQRLLLPGFAAANARMRTWRPCVRNQALKAYASKPPLSHCHPDCLAAYVEHGFRCAGGACLCTIAAAALSRARPAQTRDLADGSVELCCAPETESAIFALGPRAGAEEKLHRVHCAVTVAVGGRDAREGPARLAPHVALLLPNGRLETCAPRT